MKQQQANWIGRSEGAQVDFALCDLEGNPTDETITVFTTRADTLFGCSFFVLAPEYAGLEALVAGTEYEKPVMEFAEAVSKATEGKNVVKVIVIPDRLVNIVVK